ncbi:hypothetical protein ALPO108162_03725 [Alicyclobacillus pomorum]
MARNTTKQRRQNHSPSPMNQYYAGQITAQEYVEIISRSLTADNTRRASEKRVKRILKVLEHTV